MLRRNSSALFGGNHNSPREMISELSGTPFSTEEMLIRLGLATSLGLLVGLDREVRGMSAGIRTHALVSLSAAVTTISALILYLEVRSSGGTEADPLRVIQGLAQAIGFIAAGVIFFSKGNVHNLTTAANVWLATAIGIAAGAGQFALALAAAGFGILIVTVLRFFERFIPGSDKAQSD
jgi:putative Mg2+ transporter-C (MgtC) family protein